jgi:hypothetical protein
MSVWLGRFCEAVKKLKEWQFEISDEFIRLVRWKCTCPCARSLRGSSEMFSNWQLNEILFTSISCKWWIILHFQSDTPSNVRSTTLFIEVDVLHIPFQAVRPDSDNPEPNYWMVILHSGETNSVKLSNCGPRFCQIWYLIVDNSFNHLLEVWNLMDSRSWHSLIIEHIWLKRTCGFSHSQKGEFGLEGEELRTICDPPMFKDDFEPLEVRITAHLRRKTFRSENGWFKIWRFQLFLISLSFCKHIKSESIKTFHDESFHFSLPNQ